jgi:hypothetical protein
LAALNRAGCSRVYIDGSFVTVKREPGDYDCSVASFRTEQEFAQ